jgi:hemerythrin-like domain-containing protein
MLKRLMQDHKHIAVLLDILSEKRQRLASGSGVDFKVIRDIVEYMQLYAEHSHHPLEDITYEYFLEKSDSDKDDKLALEHQRLIKSSETLMFTINLILSDVVIAREQLVTDLAEYVALQQAHMEYEEVQLFPAFSRLLSHDDWLLIRERCQKQLIDDPLFSDGDDDDIFESLRAYIAKVDGRF